MYSAHSRQIDLPTDLNNKRILLVKQSSLGDIIHTLPVVHALKRCFPSCHIGWIVEQGYAALLTRDAAVDRVYPIHIPSTSSPNSGRLAYFSAFSATLKVLLQMRSVFHTNPYDLILDLHASFRSGLLALMNSGGVRVGFADARELNTFFQHHLVTIPSGTVHAVDKNLLFSAFLGAEAEPADFFLCSNRSDDDQVEHFLSEAGIGAQDRIVYVNPTARWQSKFWLASRWSALCDKLLAAGVYPVLGGSREDRPYIATITEQMTEKAVVAAGHLSLTESVALMKRALTYVGLDTGPMHMAAMAGTPVVALFGPTHPDRVGPYRVKNAVIQAEGLACLCCRKRVCDHLSCMRGITVDIVYEKVMAFLESSSPDREIA
jgi:lipopolysaccharide heptosyltransferase I